jgi:hypothetical protein
MFNESPLDGILPDVFALEFRPMPDNMVETSSVQTEPSRLSI